MRALVFMTVVLTSFGLHSLYAQDQGKPAVGGGQPAQPQDHTNAPTKQATQSDSEKQRTLNRMGPGIDWDHRKPGRHLRISPHRQDGT